MMSITNHLGQTPRYINSKEAEKLLGLKPNTLRSWRCRRIGPPYYKVGRNVMYCYYELLEWLKARKHTPLLH